MDLAKSSRIIDRSCEKRAIAAEPFHLTLAKHGLKLERDQTTTLQINMGLLCNQTCRHCHLNTGPGRKEHMNSETAAQIVNYSKRCSFEVIDITGGSPELNHNLPDLIERLSPLASRIMIRSNLSALYNGKQNHLAELLKEHGVVIVASFPSLNEAQTESQRGAGVFSTSIAALKKLNTFGYGLDGSGLELNLVSNPTGAFLPSSQSETEKRFHQVLSKKWGIVFNNLFTFANVPLGRFRDWLLQSGNLDRYMENLSSGFNPCAVEKVMCRTMVSVSWDGYIYDCDFNLARGLYMGGRKTHITEMTGPPDPGSPISVADHCYTCTAGTGFT